LELAEFELLVTRHEKDLYTFCCHLAITRDWADELYQETLLKSLEIIHKINTKENPKAYLFAVAIRIWKNIQRKAGRRKKIAPTVPLDDMTDEPSGNKSVENQAEQSIRDITIRKAVAGLEDRYKIPILLMYFGEYNVAEISRICSLPEGTVKSRLQKGRGMVRVILEKEGFTYAE